MQTLMSFFAFQMYRQEHSAGFKGAHVMAHVRVQNQDRPRTQFMVAPVRLHDQLPFQNVNCHQPVRRMIGQFTAWLKDKNDLRDGGALKDGDLTMTVFCRVRFRA